jgi:hypothetical protein
VVLAGVLGFAVLFVVFWIALFHLFASLSGWRALARSYPALGGAGAAAGTRFRMRSAQLARGVNYNNGITFTAGAAGLGVSMPWLFSFGHAPIEVPWSEIRTEPERVWWFPVVTLRFARAPSVPVKLRRPLAEEIARASGGRLALPAELPR